MGPSDLVGVALGGAIGLLGSMIGSVLPELVRRRQQRLALEAGLVAEIESLLRLVKRRRYREGIEQVIATAEDERDPLMRHWYEITVEHDPLQFYHANITQLGLLRSRPSVGAVFEFYTGAEAILEDLKLLRVQPTREPAQILNQLQELLALFERVVAIGEEITSLSRS